MYGTNLSPLACIWPAGSFDARSDNLGVLTSQMIRSIASAALLNSPRLSSTTNRAARGLLFSSRPNKINARPFSAAAAGFSRVLGRGDLGLGFFWVTVFAVFL